MYGSWFLSISTNNKDQSAMKQRELLEQSIDDLRLQLENHQRMIHSVLEGSTLEAQCRQETCRHRQQLFCMLAETVQVLDETRKAFKSKPLEQLRLRLLRTLSEEASDMATKAGCS
jgi:hypothetical protein